MGDPHAENLFRDERSRENLAQGPLTALYSMNRWHKNEVPFWMPDIKKEKKKQSSFNLVIKWLVDHGTNRWK